MWSSLLRHAVAYIGRHGGEEDGSAGFSVVTPLSSPLG